MTGITRPSLLHRAAAFLVSGLAACVAAVLFLTAAPPAPAQDLTFFRIGTGTTGGTYFPIGGLIANAISNPPGSRPCDRGGSCGVPGLIAVAQATSGSVENIDGLRAGVLEAALVQADVSYWAHQGSDVYGDELPFTELRAVANLYPEAVHIVVRADSDIRTIEDLRGKIVSIGEEGSGTLVDARIILDAYGIGEDEIDARYLRPGPAGDLLVGGEIDAFFIVGGHPVQAVTDAAERIPVRLLPLSGETARALEEDIPFFTATIVPGNTYPEVPGARTLAVGAQFVVRSDLSDELIYGVTRALWHPSTRRLLEGGHPKGGRIRLETALKGIAVPLHPGAERYYRELGMAVARDDALVPETVPASAEPVRRSESPPQ